MRSHRNHWMLALLLSALALASCSSNPTAPEQPPANPDQTNPTGNRYPTVPQPTSPTEVIPDVSDSYSEVVSIDGKNVDFAPIWSSGQFTWDIDMQTQYDQWFINGWGYIGDPPADYWDGQAKTAGLIFEGGRVNLTKLEHWHVYNDDSSSAITKRIVFMEHGSALGNPYNPNYNAVTFNYAGNVAPRVISPALFWCNVAVPIEAGYFQRNKANVYYAAATAATRLTAPVYLKRTRSWKRMMLGGDGGNLKSVIIDPGLSYHIEYERTTGTSFEASDSIAYTLDGTLKGPLLSKAIQGSLEAKLSASFDTTVTLNEQSKKTIGYDFNGIDGKTTVVSVWNSVEHYEVTDKDGNPYTDPNFTFSTLGSTEIVGEYEWLSSTQFDKK